jgi:hypothetical protein
LYLLHPVLIEVYDSVPWTQNENFVPMELLLVAVFVAALLACCGLTHRFIEAPCSAWEDGSRGDSTPGSARTGRRYVARAPTPRLPASPTRRTAWLSPADPFDLIHAAILLRRPCFRAAPGDSLRCGRQR